MSTSSISTLDRLKANTELQERKLLAKPTYHTHTVTTLEVAVMGKKPSPPPSTPTSSSPSRFLILPSEIRNIIYTLLLRGTIVPRIPDPSRLIYSSIPSVDITLTRSKATHHHLTRPPNLFLANKQIHNEMSTLLYTQNISHVKIVGDFLFGLTPTISLFKLIKSRPWIASCAKTVTVSAKIQELIPVHGGVRVNTMFLNQNPWLVARLKKAKVRVYPFSLGDEKGKKRDSFFSEIPTWLFGQKHSLQEQNTFCELVTMLESFSHLKNVNIETEYQGVLELLLTPPRELAEHFYRLVFGGVGVQLVLRRWQVPIYDEMPCGQGFDVAEVRVRVQRSKSESESESEGEGEVAAGAVWNRVAWERESRARYLLDAGFVVDSDEGGVGEFIE